MSEWVFFNKLARSSRPGYPSENIGPAVVSDWIEDLKRDLVDNVIMKYEELPEQPMVPLSLVTFLSHQELREFYTFDLLDYYRSHGFEVYHIPTEDPVYKNYEDKSTVFTFAQLSKLNEIYERCKHPLIIHCSAGVDRTGAAVSYLKLQHPNDFSPIDKQLEKDRNEAKAIEYARWQKIRQEEDDARIKQQQQMRTWYQDPDVEKPYRIPREDDIWSNDAFEKEPSTETLIQKLKRLRAERLRKAKEDEEGKWPLGI